MFVMKIAVPDLISPSYLPAEAAVTLGFLEAEGIKAELELIAPVEAAYAAMRDGRVDIVAGSAHAALSAFPRWEGAQLLCAQSQGLYWFLVMRSDIGAKRGDLSCVKGRRIGAAPWVGMGLRQMLADSGIDMKRDGVDVVTVPGSVGQKINIGVVAARALAERSIDGFWANGMGAEIAVLSGAGKSGNPAPGPDAGRWPSMSAKGQTGKDTLTYSEFDPERTLQRRVLLVNQPRRGFRGRWRDSSAKRSRTKA